MITRRTVLQSLAMATAQLATAGRLNAAASTGSDFYEGYPHQIKIWPHRYFVPQEFASKGNGFVRIKKDLVFALDRVRRDLDMPLVITSGYRDPAHNARVGGARYSRHLVSDAVDLSMVGMSAPERKRLMALLLREGFTSLGTYSHIPNMAHADMRPNAAIWHHGGGSHPAWFRAALHEAGWQRGIGATQ
jgi:hypothetical protein